MDELMANSLPLTGNRSGLYFLFNHKELVYIGRGWNCLLRVAEHTRKDSGKEFTSWNFLEFEDEDERNTMEKELIESFKPKYNRT